MTDHPAAGTADRYSGACLGEGGWGWNPEHRSSDVWPYVCALKLEKAGHDTLKKYLEVRPINGGKTCDSSPFTGVMYTCTPPQDYTNRPMVPDIK